MVNKISNSLSYICFSLLHWNMQESIQEEILLEMDISGVEYLQNTESRVLTSMCTQRVGIHSVLRR